jgi:hypothetical protein
MSSDVIQLYAFSGWISERAVGEFELLKANRFGASEAFDLRVR